MASLYHNWKLRCKNTTISKTAKQIASGLFPIVCERSKDANNKDKDLKAKIYYIAVKTILQRIYPSLTSIKLRKGDINNVLALLEHKDGIELVCADSYKRRCYLVLTGVMENYKEQVLITGIKANIQYLICYIPPKKEELVTLL